MILNSTVSAVVTGGASGLGAATARALAAKGVKVPPIEMFTNKTPMVAYLSRSETGAVNRRSRSISAASVMAAGSVMKDPSKGRKLSARK